jgi:hypothetical protein
MTIMDIHGTSPTYGIDGKPIGVEIQLKPVKE